MARIQWFVASAGRMKLSALPCSARPIAIHLLFVPSRLLLFSSHEVNCFTSLAVAVLRPCHERPADSVTRTPGSSHTDCAIAHTSSRIVAADASAQWSGIVLINSNGDAQNDAANECF